MRKCAVVMAVPCATRPCIAGRETTGKKQMAAAVFLRYITSLHGIIAQILEVVEGFRLAFLKVAFHDARSLDRSLTGDPGLLSAEHDFSPGWDILSTNTAKSAGLCGIRNVAIPSISPLIVVPVSPSPPAITKPLVNSEVLLGVAGLSS
ncbi:hypothetical protein QC762_0016760 [Podospora pseudocomata]|uniref:Uncharacterized protein n=1 Tax=Podospora pseudocomata TaxID=2093779 RepID=A0ABR0GWU7_9PEZI|nr:hypothetical protein QC762_0016760 [Podospora pseudocomata]